MKTVILLQPYPNPTQTINNKYLVGGTIAKIEGLESDIPHRFHENFKEGHKSSLRTKVLWEITGDWRGLQ